MGRRKAPTEVSRRTAREELPAAVLRVLVTTRDAVKPLSNVYLAQQQGQSAHPLQVADALGDWHRAQAEVRRAEHLLLGWLMQSGQFTVTSLARRSGYAPATMNRRLSGTAADHLGRDLTRRDDGQLWVSDR
ncbi:hypothetical protein [Tsukamurella soli]|uniref:Uncharacterized protein n=1 Tax=Tsukamurella soli TaxID=644556 RepID=A0ABP8KC01_9ACTN